MKDLHNALIYNTSILLYNYIVCEVSEKCVYVHNYTEIIEKHQEKHKLCIAMFNNTHTQVLIVCTCSACYIVREAILQ